MFLTLKSGLLLVIFCVSSAASAAPEYSIGPVPEWVERVVPDDGKSLPAAEVSDGIYYLLSDIQTRVGADDKTQYRHFASKAISVRGVEIVANVEIRFDPSYETLILHSVQVRREGRIIPKLNQTSVRILQREKDLEYNIYDGSKTANLFLDDVRVGDVVEYAYTLRGHNPVFGNRMFGGLDLQWSVPVRRVYGRLLWPIGREIYFAYHGTSLKPTISQHKDYREYRWDAQSVPALTTESSTPGWYDAYPRVQWSEFKDWQSVAAWALPLYRAPDRSSPSLQSEIDRIAKASSDPQERLLAVLRFVQREIRYLGVEIGVGSHAPSPPSLVLERRFGDCKDKALLTVAMLQSLGIEAHPALVHTGVRRGIRSLHPTPSAFNHVVVQAHVAQREYWIDPTRAPQLGDLTNLYQPDYGYALVVAAPTRDLTAMPKSTVSKRTIHVVMDARDGLDKPARYTVKTTLEGASADAQRATLATTNHEELQKKYLNYYARYYPSIATDAPFAVSENERANRVTVAERYVIAEFAKHVEKRKRREIDIYVPDISELLRRPREPVRRAPLHVAHPIEVTQTTEVLLPGTWTIEPKHFSVDDPAFAFERRIAYEASKGRLIVTDRYQSRVDHVAPADIARYVANLDRADAATNYGLYRSDVSVSKPLTIAERFNWPVATIAIIVMLAWIALARKLYRYDPPPTTAPIDPKLQGISGWLVLPALGAIVHPIRSVIEVAGLVPAYAADTWANLTTAGSAAYHPLWAPLLLFELVGNSAIIVFSVLFAVLFFQKRRSAPMLFIVTVPGSVIVQLLDMSLASAIPASSLTAKDWSALARGAVTAAVWTAYFLVSKRVKSTFVNEYGKARLPARERARAA